MNDYHLLILFNNFFSLSMFLIIIVVLNVKYPEGYKGLARESNILSETYVRQRGKFV